MNRLFLFGLAVLLAPIANGVAEKMEPADPHASHALGKVELPGQLLAGRPRWNSTMLSPFCIT